MCTAVNRRMDKEDLYIGRTGGGSLHAGNSDGFGNPFIVGTHGQRGECVKLFEAWFYSDDPAALKCRARVEQRIKPGMKLGCFCKPQKCHGDVIAAYVNSGYQHPLI